jgi:hypothetical protein
LFFSQALALSESQHEKRIAKLAQATKNAELEVLVNSQAERITKFEAAFADLKREKGSVAAGYLRLSEKHKMFTETAEREKMELVEPHAMGLLNFEGTWIWRLVATLSTARMFATGSTKFTKQWLHCLMRFKRGACPSAAEVQK